MHKATLFLVLASGALILLTSQPLRAQYAEEEEGGGAVVEFSVNIMSQCPFASKLLTNLIPVVQQLGDRVRFRLDYIGTYSDGAFQSMHGETEVKGDILQLCARDIGDDEAWLSFVKCQAESFREIPEDWEECAGNAGFSSEEMNACFRGPRGRRLLADSFQSSADVGATGSPTMWIDGEPYKGGRSRNSLGRALCARIADPPTYCAQIPEPVSLPVIVVGDSRCTSRACDTKRFVAFVTNTFEGAQVREFDYSDEEGRSLFEKTGERFLPVAIFGAAVVQETDGYARMERRLKRLEGMNAFLYPLGRDWDPAAEICDNGQDDTGDGRVDCDDPTCVDKRACRPTISRKLDIFAMSKCPYAIATEEALDAVLAHFKYDRSKIDFRIDFIGREVDGEPVSMHGQSEVDEDKRQLCAQEHYPEKHKFMKYVLCRNADKDSDAWERCAKGPIKASVIRECAEGEEGAALLRESFAAAEQLGITGSPTWLLNNRLDLRGRDSEAIKTGFCGANPGTPGCDKPLKPKKKSGGGGADKGNKPKPKVDPNDVSDPGFM